MITKEKKGWHASLHLRFNFNGKRTVIGQRFHQGPLLVQRPFYPEDNGTCHVYILHPPGGVVGGDHLNIDIEVDDGALVLVTTPAAGKFYRSNGLHAQQQNKLKVSSGASLEWFPQENIVFNGALAKTKTHVELDDNCFFMGWDIICLGGPAAGVGFTDGFFQQSFEIWRKGKPFWIERSHYKGNSPVLSKKWGLAGCPVSASFVCVTKNNGLVKKIQEIIGIQNSKELFSVTRLNDVLVCRYLGYHAEQAKKYFISAWEILRPAVLKQSPCVPRIWHT